MIVIYVILYFFFFKQKTAYEMRISNWSSDVCSSDLVGRPGLAEILPGQHVDPARAEQRPQRHLDGAGVGSRHDGDAVVLGDAEDSAVAVAPLVELRSEERRVGNECVITSSFRWSPIHSTKTLLYIFHINYSFQ